MATNPNGIAVNAILCDSAVTAEGKLFIQGGGWDHLNTNVFPFQQSRISVGLIISLPYGETNRQHILSLHVEDQDGARLVLAQNPDPTGEPVTDVNGGFNVGRPPTLQSGDAQSVPYAINMDQLRFDAPGSYSIVISIDAEEVERLTFRVMSMVGVLMTGG